MSSSDIREGQSIPRESRQIVMESNLGVLKVNLEDPSLSNGVAAEDMYAKVIRPNHKTRDVTAQFINACKGTYSLQTFCETIHSSRALYT